LSTFIIFHTVCFWCLGKANNTHKSAVAQMLTVEVFSFSVHLLKIYSWQAIKQLSRNNVSFTSLYLICFFNFFSSWEFIWAKSFHCCFEAGSWTKHNLWQQFSGTLIFYWKWKICLVQHAMLTIVNFTPAMFWDEGLQNPRELSSDCSFG
jgi:hypothetical protein